MSARQSARTQAPVPPRRGLASLVVIMVLLLIVSLVAGYSARNLIFEQRTGVNQYRSTLALEAADAGLEWGLAMLNGGIVDGACKASAAGGDRSFRDRYLTIAPSGGLVTPVVLGPVVDNQDAAPTPSCVFEPQADAASTGPWWRCTCPSGSTAALDPSSSTGVAPAYRVRLQRIRDDLGTERTQPGVVRLEALACTRLDGDCLTFGAAAGAMSSDGRAYTSIVAGFVGNAAGIPMTPLVARGTVAWTGGALLVSNGHVPVGGITVQAGGAVDPTNLSLVSTPGTPGVASAISNDTNLAAQTTDRMFASVFRMWPDTFRQQPAAVVIRDCALGGCSAQSVRDALSTRPGSPIWVEGDLAIDSSGDIGSATAPALVVVNGQINVTQAGVTVYGLAYLRGPAAPATLTWSPANPITVFGAVIVDGSVSGSGASQIIYDAALLERLRVTVGSFVRVPGSWRDFVQ